MDNHLSSPFSIADYLQILTLGGIKFRTSCCYISDSVSHWNLGVGVLFTACFWAATPENARPLPLGGISISGKVKIAGLRATDEDVGGKHQSPPGKTWTAAVTAGVSMYRWRIQVMTASSPRTTQNATKMLPENPG
jgi:hypothetical protein